MTGGVHLPAVLGLFYTGPVLAYLLSACRRAICRRQAKVRWVKWALSDPSSEDIEIFWTTLTPDRATGMLLEFKTLAQNPTDPG